MATAGISSHTNLPPRYRGPDGDWKGLLCASLALAHLLEGEMDRALGIAGLSARGFVALLEIVREETPSQESLARRLGVGRAATSELLKRLRRQGLVAATAAKAASAARPTRPGPRGGRPPRAVTLTPAGRALLEEAARIATRLEAEWAARLAVADPRGIPGIGRAYGLKRWVRECTADLRRPAPPRTEKA
jgi:DNA-binding MarR family transcriptional regulator